MSAIDPIAYAWIHCNGNPPPASLKCGTAAPEDADLERFVKDEELRQGPRAWGAGHHARAAHGFRFSV